MQSKATSVEDYLAELPEDRRAAIQQVRQVILKNLDKGFVEGMQYGMIGYFVPHSLFPDGYHCDPKQPLPFAALASQKNSMSLYMMGLYSDAEENARFVEEWTKTGKKLDMGKSCIRFKKVEDLALDVIGRAFKRSKVKGYIALYQAGLAKSKSPKKSATKGTTALKKAKAAPKKAAKKSTKK